MEAFPSDEQFPKGFQASLQEAEDRADEPREATSADLSNSGRRPSILVSLIWEILSLALAAAALFGFIAILRKHENKEVPRWYLGHVEVTLNTIISIVSTLFRGSLLMPVAQSISQLCWTWYTRPRSLQDICYYDSASRGPLGSIRWLFRLRFIHIASLGAFITIAALALDPFFQQSVRYNSQSAVDPTRQAQTAAAHTYDTNNTFTGEFENAYLTLPYSMKAATYNGVLSSNLLTLPTPPFSCPTGNCTWDPFSTLAISSQRVNITNLVSLNCTNASYNGTEYQYCNLMAPNDQTLQSLLNGSTSWNPFYIESGIPRNFLPVLESYANMTGFLAMTQWVKAHDHYIIANTTFEAGRCFFYFSVIEVQAQVNNGVYLEEILQEYTRSENPPTTPTYTLNITGGNPTEFFFQDPFSYNMSSNILYKPLFAKKPPNTNDTFIVPYNIFGMLGSQLDGEFLNGNVDTGTSSGLLGEDGLGNVNDMVLMLYQANNLTRAMLNMAQYMTTEIRAIDSNTLQQAQQNSSLLAPHQAIAGTVLVQKQFVIVEWAWLALPIVLLILTTFLLLAAFLQTRITRVGLWQSSPLTIFFHGQPRDDFKLLGRNEGALNTADGMQKAAAGLRARVTKSNRGAIEIYQNVNHHA